MPQRLLNFNRSSRLAKGNIPVRPELVLRLPEDTLSQNRYSPQGENFGILGAIQRGDVDLDNATPRRRDIISVDRSVLVGSMKGDHALQASAVGFEGQDYGEAFIDRRNAGADDGAQLIDIGNPAHPRVRREWELKWGQQWPRDPVTGRNYDVAHIRARADGGTDTVDNIRPMHPDAHRAEHLENGDSGRWGKRASIARTFGGRVESIRPGLRGGVPLEGGGLVRGLGILSFVPIITGILSGRIRTDNPDNTLSDILGVPSQEDEREAHKPGWIA